MWKHCAILLLSLLLGACQPSDPGRALQDDYLQRLANGLDSPLADQPALTLEHWRLPPRRERLLEIEPLRISLLDLLIDLHRCPRLQQLISERNNSLGKQMTASRRLGYEGQLIRALEECLPLLASEETASEEDSLQSVLDGKRQQLRAVFWNAVNGSPEVESYLRFAKQGLAPSGADDGAALLALEQLASLAEQLPQQLPPTPEQLDELFFALHRSTAGGQLIHSLLALRQSLEAGSQLLETRQTTRPLCPLGTPTPRGRRAQNLFVKFYAGELQPYLAEVDQRGQRWSAALRRLAAAPDIPVATRQYLQRLAGEEQSLWSEFRAASRRHVKAWQDTLRSCQLAPGQAGWSGAR
ncbi:DUF3080 family protein [Pseudomonas sp. NW5]|uniref:DUF3080 family protein n=1 Tax=Pseudomonas sp. NW5 TaxID=2934934 RepID=UPI0020201785|nr:DUF3080 family protein [Pseudomonas sp. NW5]MCL7462954.1 DUF3080 domain-containing protein [Pseudomonas sp. NW5]